MACVRFDTQSVDVRTYLYAYASVNRDQLVRALRAYGRKNGLDVDFDASRGKGGHGRISVGARFTTVPSGEIKAGLLRAILRQLGLPPDAV